MKTILFIALCVVMIGLANAALKTVNGVLIDVHDDCDPKMSNSCGDGKCCVKQTLAHIPEFAGPRPTYRIACAPLQGEHGFCITKNVGDEMCPCGPGLECHTEDFSTTFGHCARK